MGEPLHFVGRPAEDLHLLEGLESGLVAKTPLPGNGVGQRRPGQSDDRLELDNVAFVKAKSLFHCQTAFASVFEGKGSGNRNLLRSRTNKERLIGLFLERRHVDPALADNIVGATSLKDLID